MAEDPTPLLDGGSNESVEVKQNCPCERVYYGNIILMLIVAFILGLVSGVYWSIPWAADMCKNVTHT
jgi:hypothetical protein